MAYDDFAVHVSGDNDPMLGNKMPDALKLLVILNGQSDDS
jgi:hypothetical protein